MVDEDKIKEMERGLDVYVVGKLVTMGYWAFRVRSDVPDVLGMRNRNGKFELIGVILNKGKDRKKYSIDARRSRLMRQLREEFGMEPYIAYVDDSCNVRILYVGPTLRW